MGQAYMLILEIGSSNRNKTKKSDFHKYEFNLFLMN